MTRDMGTILKVMARHVALQTLDVGLVRREDNGTSGRGFPLRVLNKMIFARMSVLSARALGPMRLGVSLLGTSESYSQYSTVASTGMNETS